jgi:hypothetical protein
MVRGHATSTLSDVVYDRFSDQALRVLARECTFTSSGPVFAVRPGGPSTKLPSAGLR